ncbi:MAG: hypothetical protein ABFD83_01085 [Armatimonadota bacterium]
MRLTSVVICVIIALTAATCAQCARTVSGTLLSVAADSSAFVLDTGKYSLAKGAKVMRGQVGKDMRAVGLRDLAQGDHVVAVVNQNGSAASVKGLFGVMIGTAAGVKDNKLSFEDGRSVTVRPEAQVILGNGSIGKPSDIKRGMLIKCRVSPTSSQAWTLFAAMPDKKTAKSAPAAKAAAAKKQSKPAQAKTSLSPDPSAKRGGVQASPASKLWTGQGKPVSRGGVEIVNPFSKQAVKQTAPTELSKAKPKISSVTFSAPTPLRSGDLLTVDVSGTPGGRVRVEIKDLIKSVTLDEMKPGAYRGVVEIPADKSVKGAALVARLSVNGVVAAPVQASRLVSVEPIVPVLPPLPAKTALAKNEQVEIIPAMQPASAPQVTVPVDQPKESVEAPAPEPEPEKIVLTNPPDGASIKRALLIKGTAEPDAKVLVNVTYSNGLVGLLKLSGEVTSQMAAVDKDGEFKVGPIALEGPLATQGLEFTIKAYYPDRGDHGTAIVKVLGARN